MPTASAINTPNRSPALSEGKRISNKRIFSVCVIRIFLVKLAVACILSCSLNCKEIEKAECVDFVSMCFALHFQPKATKPANEKKIVGVAHVVCISISLTCFVHSFYTICSTSLNWKLQDLDRLRVNVCERSCAILPYILIYNFFYCTNSMQFASYP